MIQKEQLQLIQDEQNKQHYEQVQMLLNKNDEQLQEEIKKNHVEKKKYQQHIQVYEKNINQYKNMIDSLDIILQETHGLVDDIKCNPKVWIKTITDQMRLMIKKNNSQIHQYNNNNKD